MVAEPPAAQILFVTHDGAVSMPAPLYRCSAGAGGCLGTRRLHPVEVGCFPSTPQLPTVWYDLQLLQLAHNLKTAAALACNALVQALARQHGDNGFDAAVSAAALQHIGTALEHWYAAQCQATSPSGLGVTGISSDPCGRCPCCHRTCASASADACLGLKRFRNVARASQGLAPANLQTPFVAEAQVQQQLERHGKLDPAALERPACADFKAASTDTRRAALYDRMGVAAVVCRHGFVLTACSLFTEENHTYYLIMVDELLRYYGGSGPQPAAGDAATRQRHVGVLHVDIACQFEATLRR